MITETLYKEYLAALLAGNRSACHGIVQQQLDAGIEIKTLYGRLFQRSMYEVGELWESNRITVAREHLATSITESLMNLVYPTLFATARVGKTAVISCSANEFHQIGGRMIADLLELNGWDGHFLGANTPPEDLAAHVHEVAPDFVGLSLSLLSNLPQLERCIQTIRADFPNLNLLVGGQAFRWGGLDTLRKYPGTEYVATLDDLEKELQWD